jgi:alpha-glucuronidase
VAPVQGRVSGAVYERVDERLAEQLRSAQDWRDTVNTYFIRRSGKSDQRRRPIP